MTDVWGERLVWIFTDTKVYSKVMFRFDLTPPVDGEKMGTCYVDGKLVHWQPFQ